MQAAIHVRDDHVIAWTNCKYVVLSDLSEMNTPDFRDAVSLSYNRDHNDTTVFFDNIIR